MLLQLVPPVGNVGTGVDITSKGFCSGVSLHVSPQLSRLHEALATSLALKALVPVVRSNVRLEQRPLRSPVLTAVEGAPVDSPLVDPPVGG